MYLTASRRRPFLSNKYDITKHKRYKELSDADKRNAFDVEKYLEHKLVFSQDTEFEVYEVNVTEEDVKEVIEEEVNKKSIFWVRNVIFFYKNKFELN